MDNHKNYYEVLEVPSDASFDDLRRAYTRAKNAYSQDNLALYSLMTKDECDQIVELIEEAYSIISDPDKRSQYDQARGLNQSTAAKPEKFQFTINSAKNEVSNEDRPKSSHIQNIVSKKKFSLEYSEDSEMEEKISEATNFTGEFLKEIREYKNVDIIRMSEMTKVSKTYIKNIEEEAFDKLPAAVYVRGFVYQYAKCLKLNPEMVASSYLSRLNSLVG